jgi:hypothetical protein
MTFWGVDFHGKDYLYQWKFLPFGLKKIFIKFQRVMDQMLVGNGFAKCYVNDIIIFNMAPIDHLQEAFERFKGHNFKLHPGKCWLFFT